jgi:hypothetical protein
MMYDVLVIAVCAVCAAWSLHFCWDIILDWKCCVLAELRWRKLKRTHLPPRPLQVPKKLTLVKNDRKDDAA